MKKLLSTFIILITSLFFASANAALIVTNNPSNPFMFPGVGGTLTLTYSGGAAVSQIAAGPQFPNQSYDNVGDVIETTFGLAPNTFAPEASISGSTFQGNIAGSMTTITSDVAYDYLSVHLGRYNVFFHFATLVAAGTDFNLTVTKTPGTQGGGLSNYRTYNSGMSPIPIPAAAFLLAPALLGFLGLRRKANKA